MWTSHITSCFFYLILTFQKSTDHLFLYSVIQFGFVWCFFTIKLKLGPSACAHRQHSWNYQTPAAFRPAASSGPTVHHTIFFQVSRFHALCGVWTTTLRPRVPCSTKWASQAPPHAILKKHVHTASSYRCWIKLERASSPSQNRHSKYRPLLIEKQKSMHSVLKQQKLWRTVSKTPLLMTHKTCNRTVNMMVKEASHQRWETAVLHCQDETPAGGLRRIKLSILQGVPTMRAWPWCSEHLHLQPTPICSSEDESKTNTSLNWKCCLVRKNSKSI